MVNVGIMVDFKVKGELKGNIFKGLVMVVFNGNSG